MRRVAGIVVAALAAGAGGIALMLESDYLTAPGGWGVFAPAVGWSFIGTGLYADWRRPENPTGRLMILLGFAWFVFDLQAANAPLPYTIGLVFGGLWGSVFLHLGVSFPSGRVSPGLDRALVVA